MRRSIGTEPQRRRVRCRAWEAPDSRAATAAQGQYEAWLLPIAKSPAGVTGCNGLFYVNVWSYFRITLSFALRARGFCFVSSLEAIIGFLLTRDPASLFSNSRKSRLTRRSSIE